MSNLSPLSRAKQTSVFQRNLIFCFLDFLAVLVVPCLWMFASSAMSACATMATAAIARRPVTAYISKNMEGKLCG